MGSVLETDTICSSIVINFFNNKHGDGLHGQGFSRTGLVDGGLVGSFLPRHELM